MTSLKLAKLLLFLFILAITIGWLTSCETKENSKEVLNIKTVYGYSNYRNDWISYQDSSHTSSNTFRFGGLFPLGVTVYFVNDINKFSKTDFMTYNPHMSEPKEIGDAYTYWNFDKDNDVFIVLPYHATSSLKTHEASHAIDAIINKLGIRNDSEIKAYMIGYIIERIDGTPIWKKYDNETFVYTIK